MANENTQTTPIKAPTAAATATNVTRIPAAGEAPTKRAGCPVTRDEFMHHAKPAVVLGDGAGITLVGALKNFSTGSFGYYGQGKVAVMVNGKLVEMQAALTLTAIGSKPEGKSK